ncbi:MAG TPA: cytochrome c oxidase assembly protein [Kofleriaceae bacterium]|nr:cytochrome c oxidase assembly protein [Kofleriaceae bacterium]
MILHPTDLPPGLSITEGGPQLPHGLQWVSWWTWDPLVIGALALAATLYTTGAMRLWRHAGVAHGLQPWQAIAHGVGITIIALALLSPLDAASDVLFSAHMAQHELLMLVAAPLIVLGRPLAPVVWSLPRGWRTAALRTGRTDTVKRVWHVLTTPAIAVLIHALTRLVWHVPALFDAALADERIHAIQHLSFFATAVLFWWTLIHGRYGRYGYGVGLAFVFVTMLYSGLLAAVLSFAREPLYAHGARSARLGIDAVVDQERAGLVMWVPAGVIMMGIGLAIFAAWLGQSERRMAHSPHASLRAEEDNA